MWQAGNDPILKKAHPKQGMLPNAAADFNPSQGKAASGGHVVASNHARTLALAVASRPPRQLEGTAYPNIIVGATSTTGAKIILNNAGTFILGPTLNLDKGNNAGSHDSISFGDYDGDGDNDLILGNWYSGPALLRNTGSGYEFVKSFNHGVCHKCIYSADFDNDGKVDFAYGASSSTNQIVYGNSELAQTSQENLSGSARSFFVADLDQDGDVDIIFIDGGVLKVMSNLNNGSSGFRLFAGPVTLASGIGGDPRGIRVADFDGDEKPDIIFNKGGSSSTSGLYLMVNTGDGNQDQFSFSTPVFIAHPTGLGLDGNTLSTWFDIADLDGDGKMDIAYLIHHNLSGNTGHDNYVYWGNGDGTFSDTLPLPGGPSSNGLVIADFNNDGKLDIFTRGSRGLPRMIYGKGNREFENYLELPDLGGGNGAAADFNALTFVSVTASTDSPTQAPTRTPTSSPTQAPTGTPTSSPTRRPTDSPSRTPWEIVLPNPDDEDVVVNFSTGSGASPLPADVAAGDEGVITTKYSATATDASAKLETFMVKGACDTSSSGGETRIPSAGTCDATASPLATVCTYRFEKTGFDAAFNLDTTRTKPILSMCEVARLELPVDGSDALVIKEYFTNVEVEFDTSASFNVTSIALEKATIAENTEQTSLSDYITASDCSVLVNEKLPPNTPLCVRISSSSTAVKIEKITDMTITGVGATATNSAPLTVVKSDGLAQYSAITSITDYDKEVVTIRTRIPTNQFDFEAEDAAIKIAGSVVVKFAERRLKVDIDRLLQTENEEETASFDINVNLASEPVALEGGEEAMMNSANDAAASKAFAILGMVFASAFALW